MSHLYPDDSYCLSDLSRLLFQPKTEWAVDGKVAELTESRGVTGLRTEYHVRITCTPKNSVDHDPRVFLLTTRFKELHRLHGALSKLHKQLYLRGVFPSFPAPRILGSTDPSVVNERRSSTESLLSFVFDSEVLRKARVLHEIVDRATEETRTGTAAVPDAFLYEGTNIMDAPITFEDAAPSPAPIVVTGTEERGGTARDPNATPTDFLFPDLSLGQSESSTGASSKRSAMKRLFPKLSTTSNLHTEGSNSNEDYLVHAGKLVATAQRAEQENEFELAFQCYKNAASSLIQGVQLESDMARRNAVRRKTAKYLVKAEKLFRLYLSYDGSVFNIDALLAASVHLQDPNLMAFKCSNHALRNYSIIGVLPDVNAARRVLLVEDKTSGKQFVMKLLEKGPSSKGRILMPTNAPHMVQLHQFFETEDYIILLLEYVKPGLLWTFLSRYLCESEARWLCSLSSNSEKVEIADGESVRIKERPDESKLDDDKYRGRRLFFSVGVDFERLAEMRDESNSTEDPSSCEVLCTMGEDCTGTATAPAGDFFISAGSDSHALVGKEESPAAVKLGPASKKSSTSKGLSPNRSLSSCLIEICSLLTHRRPSWHSHEHIPEVLIVHWMAQLVSWFYIMHNEHEAFVGDFTPENILIGPDGNLLVTYYGIWNGESRPKQPQEGYSAPESFSLDWDPCPESDVWTLGALLFELVTGRQLAVAAPHGVESCPELPIPDYLDVSFVVKDVLEKLLSPVDSRLSLEELRGHDFFAPVDWSLYDNPYSHPDTLNRSCSSSSVVTSSSEVVSSMSCPVLAPSDLMQIPDVEV